MDGFWYGMMDGYPYPFYGMFIWMGIVWVLQLVVGYFVFRDARERGMSPVLWFILVVLPMIGWLFLVIYVVIRETGRPASSGEKSSAGGILDERFAKGEITAEDYRKMKEELNR
ncbi:MAG TPA: SHOCT domain-containing protein [Methanomicrobiales archaeon]|nr:SHOCT domain-containing protein [Methanomicrobiales archaeon]